MESIIVLIATGLSSALTFGWLGYDISSRRGWNAGWDKGCKHSETLPPEVGITVTLKSGGPVWTVEKIDHDVQTGRSAVCARWDQPGPMVAPKMIRETIPLCLLKRVVV